MDLSAWASSPLLAVAVLALVVTGNLALALVRRPQRGLLVLAALLPFDGLLLLVPEATWLSPWKEALVLGVLAATLFAPDAARAARPAPDQPRRLPGWAVAAAALFVLGAASAIAVGGPAALWGLKISSFYLLVPVVLWRCPFDARERDALVTILMSTGVVTALVGLVQQVAGPERLNALGYEYNTAIRFAGGFLRSFSTFTQPFSFGLFLTLVLLVCLPVAASDVRRLRNLVFLTLTPVLVVGMATSVVRGAFLGLAAGLVLLFAWRYRGLAHLLVPAAVTLLVVPTATLTAFVSSDSLGQRTTGWGKVLDQALSAPLGAGIGTTGAAAEKAVEQGAAVSDVLVLDGQPYQPDNYYVRTLLELGPLGLWLVVLVGVAGTLSAVRIARRSVGTDRALAEGVAASLVGAAAASVVSTYLEIFPLDFYFWLLLGVLLCLDPPSTSTPSRSDPAAAGSRPTSASSSAR